MHDERTQLPGLDGEVIDTIILPDDQPVLFMPQEKRMGGLILENSLLTSLNRNMQTEVEVLFQKLEQEQTVCALAASFETVLTRISEKALSRVAATLSANLRRELLFTRFHYAHKGHRPKRGNPWRAGTRPGPKGIEAARQLRRAAKFYEAVKLKVTVPPSVPALSVSPGATPHR